MSTWDEMAEDYAVAHHTYEHLDDSENALHTSGVVRGARWQRKALLTDEAVERAARAIARAENADYWAEEIDRWEQSEEREHEAHPDEYPGMAYEDRGQFREAARAALTAAIEGDDR